MRGLFLLLLLYNNKRVSETTAAKTPALVVFVNVCAMHYCPTMEKSKLPDCVDISMCPLFATTLVMPLTPGWNAPFA
eukprot:m.73725 g.73725  ORF g.73725 m.73725 type:complete len:77 (+) comp11778_c1_seq8:1806-2036(+)